MATYVQDRAVAESASDDGRGTDCRDCALRSRCITYGWRSPGGLWFEDMVVLRPAPGCRGWIGRSADILGHFGASDDATPAERPS